MTSGVKVRVYIRNLYRKDSGCLTINKPVSIHKLHAVLEKMCVKHPEKYINVEKRYRFVEDKEGAKNICLQVQKVDNNKVVETKYFSFKETLFDCKEIIECFKYWIEHSELLGKEDKKVLEEIKGWIIKRG